MLTEPPLTVDTPLRMSISEIARAKGLTKQAVAKRVDKLERDGLLVTVIERGRKLVPIAEFDRLIQDTTDFAKVRRPVEAASSLDAGPPAEGAGDHVRAREDARRAKYDADLKEIQVRKELGELLLAADVEKAMTRCAEVMVRRIDQLPVLADDVAAAVAKSGADGARDMLKRAARDLRTALAKAMNLLAEEAEDGSAADDPTDP